MENTKKKRIKKGIIITVSVIIIAAILFLLYYFFGVVGISEKHEYPTSQAVISNTGTNKTVIDEKVTYQTINGFGASACWWGQDVGKFENRDKIMSLLYNKNNGIGLNIYRYNLGAGSAGDKHISIANRQTECFLNKDGTYNFSADASAQKALQSAKSACGDNLRVTLFANSPPVSMTKNGAGYGSPLKDDEEWVTNMDSTKYSAYADYLYKCTEYFVSEGYRVTDVSPANEPQYSWAATYNDDGTYSAGQEGCHYSKTEVRDLMNVMVDRFSGSELETKNDVRVSMFESGSAEGKGSSCTAYVDCILGKGPKYAFKNKKLRSYFDSVSLHSYWSSADTKKQAAEYLQKKYSKYSIASTEYCQMTNDENTGVYDLISKEKNGTNGMGIEYGVAMAKVICDDLTILNSTEWDWWTACSYGTYTDGLIYLNEKDHNDIKLSKRYWCLGNFSKFIDEGAVRLACSSGNDDISACAFKNRDGSKVIVYVNNSSKAVSNQLTAKGKYTVYTTDKDNDLKKTAEGSDKANLALSPLSVTTVVIE